MRGTRSASSPRSTDGNVVVAASSTADTVPMVALAATAASVSRPASCTVSGPNAYVSPPSRTSGMKSAASTTGGRTKRARRQISPGLMRARAATPARTSAAAR